jgi:hypothetical protein
VRGLIPAAVLITARQTREASHLVIVGISAVITLAMAYYLKNLRRFASHR